MSSKILLTNPLRELAKEQARRLSAHNYFCFEEMGKKGGKKKGGNRRGGDDEDVVAPVLNYKKEGEEGDGKPALSKTQLKKLKREEKVR